MTLLLFNIRSNSDLHWLLSLEAFMEWNTYPAIKVGGSDEGYRKKDVLKFTC